MSLSKGITHYLFFVMMTWISIKTLIINNTSKLRSCNEKNKKKYSLKNTLSGNKCRKHIV